jgi:hypothetical protein
VLATRCGPLTRSQQDRWLALYWREHSGQERIRTAEWPLEPPLPIAVVTAAIAELVSRHEILRTSFSLGPDGQPVQTVHSVDGFRIPVSVGPDGPPLGGPISREPPWSMALLVRESLVTTVRLRYKHIVTDAGGLREWRRQLLALCRGADVSPPSVQPLDRPAALARADTPSDPAWHVPQFLLPVGTGAAEELATTVRLSGTVGLADAVCRAAGISRPALVLFAVAWFLGRYARQDRVLFADIVAPRRTTDHSIDCQMTEVPVLVELDKHATFAQALSDVQQSTVRAVWDDMRGAVPSRELRAETVARRRIGGVSPAWFNFLTHPYPKDLPPVTIDPDECVGVRTDPSAVLGDPLAPLVEAHVAGEDLYVHLTADTRILPAAVARSFGPLALRLLETMAADVTAPVATSDVLLPPEFGTPIHTPTAGVDRVNLMTLTTVLNAAPGVERTVATVEDSIITARLRPNPSCTVFDWFDVHEYVLTQLHHHRDTAAPGRYRLLSDTARRDAHWDPDTQRPVLAPTTPAEHALCAAIQTTHGHEPRDVALTYTEAGGRILRAPAVVEHMRRHGFTGLRQEHFTTPHTLRATARLISPPQGSL